MKPWLARARAEAEQPPLHPREPLLLALAQGPCHVGSVEPAVALRMAAAGLPIAHIADGWQVAEPADTSFAALARWLDAEGLGSRWRDELLAVVDGRGREVARIERSVVRVFGLATVAVHLVGSAPDGRVWVQQRSLAKATDPGLWDTLMGGQVAAGESVETTLARETMEEAGLAIATLGELRRVAPIATRRPVGEGYLVERIEVYTAVVPAALVPQNQDGEVERFECLPRDALESRLAAGEFTLEAALILGAFLERG